MQRLAFYESSVVPCLLGTWFAVWPTCFSLHPSLYKFKLGSFDSLFMWGFFGCRRFIPCCAVQLLRWDGWQTVFWISLCTEGAGMLSRISEPLSPWYGYSAPGNYCIFWGSKTLEDSRTQMDIPQLVVPGFLIGLFVHQIQISNKYMGKSRYEAMNLGVLGCRVNCFARIQLSCCTKLLRVLDLLQTWLQPISWNWTFCPTS